MGTTINSHRPKSAFFMTQIQVNSSIIKSSYTSCLTYPSRTGLSSFEIDFVSRKETASSNKNIICFVFRCFSLAALVQRSFTFPEQFLWSAHKKKPIVQLLQFKYMISNKCSSFSLADPGILPTSRGGDFLHPGPPPLIPTRGPGAWISLGHSCRSVKNLILPAPGPTIIH